MKTTTKRKTSSRTTTLRTRTSMTRTSMTTTSRTTTSKTSTMKISTTKISMKMKRTTKTRMKRTKSRKRSETFRSDFEHLQAGGAKRFPPVCVLEQRTKEAEVKKISDNGNLRNCTCVLCTPHTSRYNPRRGLGRARTPTG